MGPRIGVLALQGAVDQHLVALDELGTLSAKVRTVEQLDQVNALVIPGGESTTISMLLERNGLAAPLRERVGEGMAVFGTCAGMILCASEILDGRPDQITLDAIDLTVRRNAFGRQRDSFERDLIVTGFPTPFHGVFIRAPVALEVGDEVEVLARVDDEPVLCRQGSTLVSSFHPELTNDRRIHEMFLDLVT